MNIDELTEIISKGENEKLDFKAEWYSKEKKEELIKDIVSLANGNYYKIGEPAYLIFGIKESRNKLDFIGIDIDKSTNELKSDIIQKVSSYITPPLNELEIYKLPYNNVNLLIVEIPQHDYLFKLTKPLKNNYYRKEDILIRKGDSTYTARPEEIKKFEHELDKNRNSSSKNINRENKQSKEIKIDADNILKIVVSKRDFSTLETFSVKENSSNIFYKYYYLINRQGFLFLGNKISNKRVFLDLNEKLKKIKTKSLEIFISKQFRENGEIIDKKDDIVKKCEIVKENLEDKNVTIHYIDDLVWDITIKNIRTDINLYNLNPDFTDQFIYEEEEKLKYSLEFFEKEIYKEDRPIIIVSGSGGVGKTTLCDALQHHIIKEKKRKESYSSILKERR